MPEKTESWWSKYRFTVMWVGWIAAFVVIEAVAIFNKKKGDTLSEHVWRWFGVPDESAKVKKAFTVGRFALGAFLVWLTGHLTFGWWNL